MKKITVNKGVIIMDYEVLKAFSFKFNESRKVATIGEIIKDTDIDPLILKYALNKKKIKPVSKKKGEEVIMVREPLGKKKLNRSTDTETMKKEIEEKVEVEIKEVLDDVEKDIKEEEVESTIEEDMINSLEEEKDDLDDGFEPLSEDDDLEDEEEDKTLITTAVSFNEIDLNKKSKSELKRICTQIGVGSSGTKKMLVNRILKSGI